MKTKSKALLLTLCAVLLVAASVLGTMAYLTSSAEVKNTFTIGKVEIKLDETDVTNPTGPRVTANSYKLMPGTTYTKDPTVTVKAGSEDSYVRMKVTFNNATKHGMLPSCGPIPSISRPMRSLGTEKIAFHPDPHGELHRYRGTRLGWPPS